MTTSPANVIKDNSAAVQPMDNAFVEFVSVTKIGREITVPVRMTQSRVCGRVRKTRRSCVQGTESASVGNVSVTQMTRDSILDVFVSTVRSR